VFLRRIRPRGKGRRAEYWALLESYRTAKGSRHRVVAYLGKLNAREINGWKLLAGRLQGQAPPMPGLFDPPADQEDPVQLVEIDSIRLQDLKRFGEVYLAWVLWRLLGLDRLLDSLMPRGQESVPWPITAAILCIARLCQPASELHIEQVFYPKSALSDLLDVPAAQVNTDRLYRAMDKLLEHKKAIEQHLRRRLGELFELSYDILLYDLTSTYFEGSCPHNEQAKRGYSRDSRGDCLQVVIALVVSTDGYPLGYEVFDGNTVDVTTVKRIVQKIEAEHGKAQRIWVMDRGNVSAENLAFLRESGCRYIVGTPKSLLRAVPSGELSERGWQEVREGIAVKRLELAQGEGDTLVLCRSEDRVIKEEAMLERFVKRMEEGLEAMKKSAETGRLRDILQAHVRLGRLMDQNWRAAGCFEVKIREQEGKLQVSWTKNEQSKRALCGCYLLRTNLERVDPVELWKQYIQLVDAEWAFRITKDELDLRPVWHQDKERVQGHILVCFMAYAMWKALGGWMKASGLGDSPRTLLEEMGGIYSGDVVLPTRNGDGTAGQSLVIRCVTRPDEHAAVLLNRLGIELPNHLKRYRLESSAPPAACAVQ
jgi:transposase